MSEFISWEIFIFAYLNRKNSSTHGDITFFFLYCCFSCVIFYFFFSLTDLLKGFLDIFYMSSMENRTHVILLMVFYIFLS